jgi:hypothetical protein
LGENKQGKIKNKEGGKSMKMRRFGGILLVLAMVFAFSSMAVGKEPFFKDYNAVEVQEFAVPPNSPAPDASGAEIADKIVYQLRRYAQRYGQFDIVIIEGSKEIPAGKKTLLIKGEVTEYTRPTVGRRVGRSFIPRVGRHLGSAYFAAHYQFVDKATGKVVYETDLRTSSSGDEDTVDYAMLRNAEAAAKVMYRLEK